MGYTWIKKKNLPYARKLGICIYLNYQKLTFFFFIEMEVNFYVLYAVKMGKFFFFLGVCVCACVWGCICWCRAGGGVLGKEGKYLHCFFFFLSFKRGKKYYPQLQRITHIGLIKMKIKKFNVPFTYIFK